MLKLLVAQMVPNILRHSGTAVSAAILSHGLATADVSQQVGGATVIILTFVWSVAEKYNLLAKVL